MPPDSIAHPFSGRVREAAPWRAALVCLALAWAALFAATWPEWRAMAHQWWEIDTYAHILLIPPILAWLMWLRRGELAQIAPTGWWPGLAGGALALTLVLTGRLAGINLIAEAGAVIAIAAGTTALLGLRASLILAFPLGYSLFLVPFGDEIIGPLQQVTAHLAIGLTHLSGVPATLTDLFINTPAGRFVVAEECSGVKFLIAMTALTTLVGWTSFATWRKRAVLVISAGILSIVANGVRAWGTIFAAQFVGAERAGGIDHIIYGWVFFAVVIALVLTIAWRFFDREPEEAGLSAREAGAIAASYEGASLERTLATGIIVGAAMAFAALARLV